MTDLRQPQTIESGSKQGGSFRSGTQHPRWVEDASLLEEMAKYPLGSLALTGNVVRAGKKNEKCVEYLCSICGKTHAIYPSNVRTGKTTGCKCQRAVKYGQDPRADVLGDRYDAMLQRCTAVTNELYKNYGGRGIELRFTSREHFIRWMLKELPHKTYRDVQIDRRNNDGHYEPGNLRLVTQAENLRNKRTNRHITYDGVPVLITHLWHLVKTDHPTYPFSPEHTVTMVKKGVSPDSLFLQERHRSPTSMTSLTPDPTIVSLYRGE